jgi:hypothetical protein
MSLNQLLMLGFSVFIEGGRLRVVYLNGTQKQLSEDEALAVVRDIGKLIPDIMMTYEEYDAANYKLKQGIYRPSLRLEFNPVANCPKDPICFFNVVLTRQRSKAGHYEKGDPLPKGHFTVERKQKFREFWESCGLNNNFSPTKYHERMGKLKGIIFTGQRNEKKPNKINNVQPLELTAEKIRLLVATHKERTEGTQTAPNYRIESAHKDTEASQYWNGSQLD